MGLSDKVADAIRITVWRMFNGPDRENLTVNIVRSRVEKALHLEPGYLKEGSWRKESKSIVHTEITKLLEFEAVGEGLPSVQPTFAEIQSPPPEKSTSKPIKKGIKRSSDGDKAQAVKRRKKDDTPVSEKEDSSLTSIEDTPEDSQGSSVSDIPKTRKVKKNAVKPGRQKEPKVDRGKEKNKGADSRDKSKVPDSQLHKKDVSAVDLMEGDGDGPGNFSSNFGNGEKGDAIVMDSDSDMSVVLDEAPKHKKNSTSISKGPSSTSTSKSSKPSKTKQPTGLSPNEVELKTLQSHLTKCGVRKIWGVVLKDFGCDTGAKIRHLKGMLREIGMQGRFSEAKAKEIKEQREIDADLEAVKEWEVKWGTGSGIRNKKVGRGKKMAEPSEDDEDGLALRDKESEKPPARLAKAAMDLAFLGDEESNSD